MDLSFGEVAGLAGISSGLNLLGGMNANRTNARIARQRNQHESAEAQLARQFSAQQADIQRTYNLSEAITNRKFQERMSNTAVQRRMNDLKKAGINPLLAAKFDAGTPAGAMASSGIPATAKASAYGYNYTNPIPDISSVMDLYLKKAQIDNLKSTKGLTDNKTDITKPIAAALGIIGEFVEGFTDDKRKDARDLGEGLPGNFIKMVKDLFTSDDNTSTSGKEASVKQKLSEEVDKAILDGVKAATKRGSRSRGGRSKAHLKGKKETNFNKLFFGNEKRKKYTKRRR
jgi:hypothetical protein